MSHIPNDKQIKAFNNAVKAIKKLRDLDMMIYGKQDYLVAYTKDADNYIQEYAPLHKIFDETFGTVPCLNFRCLNDSGADDYASYISKEHHDEFNHMNYQI